MEQHLSSVLSESASQKEIIAAICSTVQERFGYGTVNFYLLDASSHNIAEAFTEGTDWPFPNSEKEWVLSNFKDHVIDDNLAYLYVDQRAKRDWVDQHQLGIDQDNFQDSCDDGLFLVFLSKRIYALGVLFINNWSQHQGIVDQREDVPLLVENIHEAILVHLKSFEELTANENLEGLLMDQMSLRNQIQKDQDDLKHRILELSVLYETSNALSYSLDYRQIVSLGMDSLYKVLSYDICAILLTDFSEKGEIITRINKPVDDDLITKVQDNLISVSVPFMKAKIDSDEIRRTLEANFTTSVKYSSGGKMNSFANLPLVFKEDIIGMLNLCSTSKNVFSRNEMTFLHTMANQLASHLGRLKAVKTLEKTKISSLIKSMSEGIIMFDENQSLEIINPMAKSLLDMDLQREVISEDVVNRFHEIGLGQFFNQVTMGQNQTLTKEALVNNRALSIKASPVYDVDQQQIGIVFMLRDFTEFQSMNRLKTQRLEVISKVNLIIKSISDLDNLLTVLMEFILNIAQADMGSIQLKQGRVFQTIVHSNFPDKIRRAYKFKSGGTISEYVAHTKEPCFIPDYRGNDKLNQNNKILLESYICIPILVKNNLIGIINIARRPRPMLPVLGSDDLETLTTITNLSGTAIYNALLYQETLKKQRIDQELKVANDIQMRLLPTQLPEELTVDFGGLSFPAREIGGDYYDFLRLSDGNIGIVVADIVGKGVPAGLFMAMLKSIVHTHLINVLSPLEALEKVNGILYKDPVIDKFIPVFYAILNPTTLELRYCNAGHEPAVLFNGQDFSLLDTIGLPLGADDEPGYEEKTLTLNPNDLVLFFTDGIVEAKNPDGDMFETERLYEIVQEYQHLSCKALNEQIVDAIREFCGNREQQDDITLVSIRAESNKKIAQQEKPIKTRKICILSAKKNIKKIRKEVEQVATEMGFPASDVFNLKLAINEAHANVIEHAYFGDENGEIIFRFLIYQDRLTIIIKDFGPGIGQRTIKGEEEHLDELEGSGLGVFLIKTVMDKVEYNRVAKVGAELVLTKYLPKPGDEGEKE